MELSILLKSGVCLAVFMLFYKLVLEHLSIHHFKRYYLLIAIVASIVIPFITFYNYVEPEVLDLLETIAVPQNFQPDLNLEIVETPIDYLSILLWSIYGLGVLVFGIKFSLNIRGLLRDISTNEKHKTASFTSVLVNKPTIPHTFFSYIFFNKKDYSEHKIPKEVLLHELTHAKQKHSLDIVFIELLQVVFWFNPLLYFIKKDIKLNHEFLADISVLEKGIDTKKYQNILLDYSISQPQHSLFNAINYPTLKKRFTLMKTKSTKTVILLRTLLIVPVVALLVYGFSTTETIELKDVKESNKISNSINNEQNSVDIKTGFITIEDVTHYFVTYNNVTRYFNPNGIEVNKYGEHINGSKQVNATNVIPGNYVAKVYKDDKVVIQFFENENPYKHLVNEDIILTINGIICKEDCFFKFTKKQVEYLIIGTTGDEEITSFNLKFPGKPTQNIKGNKINTNAKSYLADAKMGANIQLFNVKSGKIKFPPAIITLVSNTSKEIDNSPIVVKGEKSLLPAPPPPPISPNATAEEKEKYKKMISEYKKQHKIVKGRVVVKGEKSLLPAPPPPPIPQNATPDEKERYKKMISEYKKQHKIVEGKVVVKGEKSNIPPPPMSDKMKHKITTYVNHLRNDKFKDSEVFYDSKKITRAEAIKLVKTDGLIGMKTEEQPDGSLIIILSHKQSKGPWAAPEYDIPKTD
ncbi:M56 family metallopeptidase [Aurantibacter sp.]|uniref:M56 family metallopeptidase n=1 Tax=Aurantibacter sp. TaxID=2807103 RepID=UPI0035C80E91